MEFSTKYLKAQSLERKKMASNFRIFFPLEFLKGRKIGDFIPYEKES